MSRGQIMEIIEASKANKEYLGLLMAGLTPSKAAKAAPKSEKEAKKPSASSRRPSMADTQDLKTTNPGIEEKESQKRSSALVSNLLMPALAVFTGLVVGAVIIALANDAAIRAWRNFFHAPGAAFKASWDAVITAYSALFGGALGTPADLIAGFQTYFATGQTTALFKALYPITESPDCGNTIYLCRSGGRTWVSVRPLQYRGRRPILYGRTRGGFCWLFHCRPALVHSSAAGVAGRGIGRSHLGRHPRLLKAKFGAHEVVNTIMMN